MKTATVADLRNDFAKITHWSQAGESVAITKRGVPFAQLTAVAARKNLRPLDRLARLQKLSPEGPLPTDSLISLTGDRGTT
jgi:prevent-host-death family protein